MKRVAIIQSNYIPWKGYFDIINTVDEFVFLDDVQYTRRDWRNRNTIKTPQGLLWLTIPVDVKGKFDILIKDVKIYTTEWRKKHWKTINHFYSKTHFFKYYKDFFEELYLKCTDKFLVDINYRFINAISQILNIKPKFRFSWEFKTRKEKNLRLIDICRQCNANVYVSGPKAKKYLDEDLFKKQGIKIQWMDYNNYPEYSQLYPPFEHKVTILDLIFNVGNKAPQYMKTFNKRNDTF